MDSEEILAGLDEEIAQLEKQLRLTKAARDNLKQSQAISLSASMSRANSPETRFFDMRPIDAMRVVLNGHGKPMKKGDLKKTLLDGGIAIGKARAEHNVDLSIKLNARKNDLTRSGKGKDIADTEMIGLPEWVKKR